MLDRCKKWLKGKGIPSPRDNLRYVIPTDVIAFTETVLKEYGMKHFGNEGIVYWAGKGRARLLT
jgi:hypothetical protein